MSEKNDSGENQFDRSVHEQTTRRVEALPELLDETTDPENEIPAGLEEDTRPSEEVSENSRPTVKRQPHWTPVPGETDRAAQSNSKPQTPRAEPRRSGSPEPETQHQATPETHQAKSPAPAEERDSAPAKKSEEFAIDLDDDFFEDLFDGD